MNLSFILLQFGVPARSSEDLIINWIIFLLVAIFLHLLIRIRVRIGNWSHLFGNMTQNPEEFYNQVLAFLQEHQVPEFKSRTVTIHQDGIYSPQRIYLEISRGEYVFHICAAPWGTDFFFSWWLNTTVSRFYLLIIKVPILGPLIANSYEDAAYHKLDTDTMFRTSVVQAVQNAIDQITENKGVRGLTELERKPDLRSFITSK